MRNVLVIKGIGKRLGDIWVLRDVCASVTTGKVTAFIGPNGAGKTTLLHLIAGAIRPDEGSICFQGEEIAGLQTHRIARMGLGRQFQDVRIFGGLSVLDNVMMALTRPKEQDSWRAWLLRREAREALRTHREAAIRWIEHVGLEDSLERDAKELSFGQQKLLTLARLFARGCPLLLLDEPTAGVSPAMIEKIVSLIHEAVNERGVTVALVEHNMIVVNELAYWIHFLNEGRVAFSGECAHVLGNQSVRQMYMGL